MTEINQTQEIDELIGICRGIIADGHVNAQEAQFLHNWLYNSNITDRWPGSELHVMLEDIFSTPDFSQENEHAILKCLMELTGGASRDDTQKNNHPIKLGMDYPTELDHMDKKFCITGHLFSGVRHDAIKVITDLGGNFNNRINDETDYLIVGDMSNRDWKHSSYGRKIEAAIMMKSRGNIIQIVPESHWLEKVSSTKGYLIDTDDYFESWFYHLHRAHYPAIGITQTKIIDKEKTKALRTLKIDVMRREMNVLDLPKNMLSDITQKHKITKLVWKKSNPIDYDFHDGDTFWSDQKHFIQVAHVDELIEIHTNQPGKITPYLILPQELKTWLKTGMIPKNKTIPLSRVRRESARLAMIHQ